jgi:hypothetical protein
MTPGHVGALDPGIVTGILVLIYLCDRVGPRGPFWPPRGPLG